MNRAYALIGALLLSCITIASACAAVPHQGVHFTLESERGSDRIQASFRGPSGPHNDNNWSSDFLPAALPGLDVAGFRGTGDHPLRFAVIRDAGRLDCSGRGGRGSADGACHFTPDPAFLRLLESRGIARPTAEQEFGLMAVDVRRDLIDALAAARYPTPSIGDLMALSALHADAAYIAGMARAGYRPSDLGTLVQFKALDITPAWIAGFVRIGYAGLPASELVQLKALDVTPAYIAGFGRLGYRRLTANQLVQLKALDITPEFVRSVSGGRQMPDMAELIQLKIFGRRR